MKARQSDLRERILQLMQRPNYQALDKVELSKALHWPSERRAELREVLKELEKSGEIARIRKDRYVLPELANLITGKLQVHFNGNAHLLSEKQGQPDVFISEVNMGTAMHRDKVVVRLMHEGREQARVGDKMEGRVVRILERANDTIVGTIQQTKKFFYVIPDDPRFPHDVYVQPGISPLPRPPRAGDKVVVKLSEWESRHVNPEGEIVELLGPATAPGVDMLSIVRKYRLPIEFPEAVCEEAEQIAEAVAPSELELREDLRDQPIITIDPDDAKDYDDAILVERTKTGWTLGVHIADVAHYVRPGGPLDKEARQRGNSTYLADRVIPMLPERLSNGICSLKPHVERLAFSAFMQFSNTGQMKSARFAKTVIRSAARLTYKQAYAILQGKSEIPTGPVHLRGRDGETAPQVTPVSPEIAERVRAAWELASLLRKKRFESGSLDLDFPEVKVWLDEKGRAARLEKIENDVSHQLIEECMLAANEAVARELKNRQVPTVYRIHEDPDPDKLTEFREFASMYGFRAGDLTHRPEVQKLLAAIKGSAEEYALKLQFLKSLKRATYDVTPIGHYGLAKVNYTHFTSPIRRYADLVVHRSLSDLLASHEAPAKRSRRKQTMSVGDLANASEHISETERNSADAEKDSVMLKKMEYFQRQLISRKPEQFRAVVIDVRSYGLLVELPDVIITGLVHVSSLPEDFYEFDAVRLTFIGKRTRRRYKVGDVLSVIVVKVDAYKRQIDFTPVDAKAEEEKAPEATKRHKKLKTEKGPKPRSR
ncbi:ribonuclease R [Verrucomicrobiota bacterium sgz303538]